MLKTQRVCTKKKCPCASVRLYYRLGFRELQRPLLSVKWKCVTVCQLCFQSGTLFLCVGSVLWKELSSNKTYWALNGWWPCAQREANINRRLNEVCILERGSFWGAAWDWMAQVAFKGTRTADVCLGTWILLHGTANTHSISWTQRQESISPFSCFLIYLVFCFRNQGTSV